MKCFNANIIANPAYIAVKNETVRASRQFFTVEVEHNIIRRLAVEMGYIPSGVDVLKLTEAEREELITVSENNAYTVHHASMQLSSMIVQSLTLYDYCFLYTLIRLK